MAQWVRNPTVEAQVHPQAWHSGLKDPALPQLQPRLQLQLRLDPWPWELPDAVGMAIKKKKVGGGDSEFGKLGISRVVQAWLDPAVDNTIRII